MALPSGTVTFLFTDVEGSTDLVRRLRGRYHEVLADHQRLIRSAIAEGGGTEIDSQGDSFFFVFRRARDAVVAAANAQTTHNLLEDEEELPLDLRDLGAQRLKDFDRDPATLDVVEKIRIGKQVVDLTVAYRAVWVAVGE